MKCLILLTFAIFLANKPHSIQDEKTKGTNAAFYVKVDTPQCVCVCVFVCLQPEVEAGVGGRESVLCRPISPPCGPTHGDRLNIGVCISVCMRVCVCVCFLPISTSGVSLTVEDRLADLHWDKHPADLQI